MKRKVGIADYTNKYVGCCIYRYQKGLRAVKLNMVSSLTDEVHGMTVLDLGCGPGIFSNLCSERGANVVSVDFSTLMLQYARKANRELTLVKANIENLPFRTHTYDMVLALDVIEHLYKPLEFFREARRVLKDNGKLLLITPNLTYSRTWRWLKRLRLLSYYAWLREKSLLPTGEKLCDTDVRFYSVGEMESLLLTTGFTILTYDTFSEIPLFQFWNRLFSLLLKGPLKRYKWNKIFFHVEKRHS